MHAHGPQEPFIWTKHWWAVSLLDVLSKERPNPIELLGKNLVVWYEAGSGTWNCFEDLCPHRLAPLSGRVLWKHCCRHEHAVAHAWLLIVAYPDATSCASAEGRVEHGTLQCAYVSTFKGNPLHACPPACMRDEQSTVSCVSFIAGC